MVGLQWHGSTMPHWRSLSSSTSPPMTVSTACATPRRTSTGKFNLLPLHLFVLFFTSCNLCLLVLDWRLVGLLSPTNASMGSEMVCLHVIDLRSAACRGLSLMAGGLGLQSAACQDLRSHGGGSWTVKCCLSRSEISCQGVLEIAEVPPTA